MLQPKRTKFRKQHKGRIHGNAKGGYDINFGNYESIRKDGMHSKSRGLRSYEFTNFRK